MEYYLRTTKKDGKSYGGFQWPMQIGAIVEAPDWEPVADCGNGLHGLKDGLGGADHLSRYEDAVWWIVKAADAIDLDGKHKFQRCEVVAFGYRATLTGGDYATLTGGDYATLTGGNDATLTGGDHATLTGGDYATLTGGYRATLTGGNDATLIFLRWMGGRRRVLTAYVGEGGIEPGKRYRANDVFTAVVPA